MVVATPNLGLANSGGGVREGQTISIAPVGSTLEYNVLVNGAVVDKYVVNEPGSVDRLNFKAQVTITDPSGQATDISYRGSLAMNGTSYVDTGYQLNRNPGRRSSTFEGWVFPTASTGNRFVFDTAAGNGQGWALYHNGSTWFIDTGLAQFNTNQAITLNAWQHVAVVFDANGANGIRLYVNGVAAGSTTSYVAFDTVGTLDIGSDFAGANGFVGNIDEFRVWNRALTAAEVARLDDGPVPYNSPNLVGWWNFNEGTGSVAQDSSVSRNNATIRAIITPVNATATTLNPSFVPPINTINGSGLSIGSPFDKSTHTNGFPNGGGSFTFWQSLAPPTTGSPVTIEFDLGANFDLSSMLVWQYNGAGLGFDELNLGVRQYDLFVGAAPVPTSQVITDAILAKAGGTAAEPAQSISLSGLANSVRYVRMSIDSNYGGPRVGLSEVRFVGSPNLWNNTTPPVYNGTYTAVDNGTYTLTANFSDPSGAADVIRSTFVVNNVAPTIVSLNLPSTPVAVGQLVSANPTITDPGVKDKFTYLWTVATGTGQSLLNNNTRNFAFTPSFAGDYVVGLTVTDSDGASTSTSQTITVLPNVSVTVVTSEPRVGNLVTVAANLSNLASAGNTIGATAATRQFGWTIQQGAGTIATGSGSTISFIPTGAGNYTANLTVTDVVSGVPYARSASTVFQVNAIAPPTIDADGDITAPDFDGINDFIALTQTASFTTLTNNFTVAAWIKPDSATGVRRILGTQGWSFGTSGNQLIFTVGSTNYTTTSAVLPLNVWTHVAAVMLNNNSVQFFVNGIALATFTGSVAAVSNVSSATIGANFNGTAEYFDGMIRQVGVWNSALSSALIQLVRAGDLSQAAPIAYFQMQEGEGVRVTGLSINDFGVFFNDLAWANQTMASEGDVLTFNLTNLAAPIEGATRNVVWSVTPATFSLLPTSDQQMLRIRIDADGFYTVNATVTDSTTTPSSTFVRLANRNYITASNVAPTVVANDVTGFENSPFTITAQATDPGLTDTLTFVIKWSDGSADSTGAVAAGAISVTKTFTQDGIYTGTLSVTDTSNASTVRPITITIANVAPIAVNDTGLSTGENTVLNIASASLLTNDTDPSPQDKLVLSIASVSPTSAQGATVTLNADGSVTYNPNNSTTLNALRAGVSLVDTFTYVVTDGAGTSTGTVTITVNGQNDAPIAMVDIGAIVEDATPATVVGNLRSNDSDPDTGATLTISSVAGLTTTPIVGLYGQLVWNVDGSFTYTLDNSKPVVQQLALGQWLTESFVYVISDGTATASSSLTIQINGTNDAPLPVRITMPLWLTQSLASSQANMMTSSWLMRQ